MHSSLRINLACLSLGFLGAGSMLAAMTPDSETHMPPPDVPPLWSDVAPVWSPDGELIAFASNRDGFQEVYLMRADGSGVRRLTNLNASTYASSWSPDSRSLLVESNVSGDVEIYTLAIGAGTLARITQRPGRDSYPQWSPSGDLIYFASFKDDRSDLYAMDPDGGNVRQLTDRQGADLTPVPSPDGTMLAFGSDRTGDREIFILPLDGSPPRRVTNHPGFDGWPRWSPDGSQLTFTSEVAGGNNEIYIINVDGSGLRRLTDAPGHDYQSDWSPDGARLAIRSDRDGRPGICLLEPGNLKITKLTNTRLSAFAMVAWREGVAPALASIRDMRRDATGDAPFIESEVRSLGLHLARTDSHAAANLLEIGASFYPQSIPLWIALGDACLAAGRKADSIRSFERALALGDGADSNSTIDRLRRAQAD